MISLISEVIFGFIGCGYILMGKPEIGFLVLIFVELMELNRIKE